MDNICIFTLTLNTIGTLKNEFRVSEYKITRETPKKVYFETPRGLDEASKMKNKFNEIFCEVYSNSIYINAICYYKDKEEIKNNIFNKAQELLDSMKRDINDLENMFNEIKENN